MGDWSAVFSAGNAAAQPNDDKIFENILLAKTQSSSATNPKDIIYQNFGENDFFSSKIALLPPSYPLRVRGGRGLRLSTENTKTKSLVKLIVEFKFSTKKADDGLRSGEGSCLDRGGQQGEPSRLEYFAQEDNAKKTIDYLQSVSAYYTFDCYNTGKGYMQVTKAYTKSARID